LLGPFISVPTVFWRSPQYCQSARTIPLLPPSPKKFPSIAISLSQADHCCAVGGTTCLPRSNSPSCQSNKSSYIPEYVIVIPLSDKCPFGRFLFAASSTLPYPPPGLASFLVPEPLCETLPSSSPWRDSDICKPFYALPSAATALCCSPVVAFVVSSLQFLPVDISIFFFTRGGSFFSIGLRPPTVATNCHKNSVLLVISPRDLLSTCRLFCLKLPQFPFTDSDKFPSARRF